MYILIDHLLDDYPHQIGATPCASAILDILEERKLFLEPQVIAACIATGNGIDHIATADLPVGAIAFYAAYASASIGRQIVVTDELISYLYEFVFQFSNIFIYY